MTPKGSNEEARPRLSRERVVATAVEVADEDGIEALTMRRLGQALGVEAMSLYNHVANKEDLLDGMVDHVFAEIELPVEGMAWREAMAQRASSLRDALLRHRWATALMDSRTAPGPATLRHHDAVLGASRRAGLSVEMAAHAFSLIDSYVYGSVLQQLTMPFNAGEELDDEGREAMAVMVSGPMAEELPHLAELTVAHVLEVGYSFASEFEFGLGVILGALDPDAATSPG